MDIKERLRLLDSLQPKKVEAVQPVALEARSSNITSLVDGKIVTNRFGDYFYTIKQYNAGSYHGQIQLSALHDFLGSPLALLDNQPGLCNIDLEKILFIDTETTGLSGGAGTCAFLVGVGYFEGGTLQVAQYFMNDFGEEEALLHDLNEFAAQFEMLVSYNGKSYDLPLLSSRYIYQGIQTQLASMRHFDLLHTVRRLWKQRLPDCSLTTAESHLLKAERQEDIPGHLIPATYFQYLHQKDAGPLLPVFYHNKQDILALVALMVHALKTIAAPVTTGSATADILSIGKVLERSRNFERALALYSAHIESGISKMQRRDMLLRKGFIHKRLEQWNEAATQWEAAIDSAFHPLPYIELAKHLEHRAKDNSKAKGVVEKALKELEILSTLQSTQPWDEHHADLQYRLSRLQRKELLSDSGPEE